MKKKSIQLANLKNLDRRGRIGANGFTIKC